MREQLHEDDQLAVFLTIDEGDDKVRLDIVSRAPEAVDLSVEDEVIVIMDGRGVPVDVEDEAHARAELGPAEELTERPFEVMLRVHEFFDGWKFGES